MSPVSNATVVRFDTIVLSCFKLTAPTVNPQTVGNGKNAQDFIGKPACFYRICA